MRFTGTVPAAPAPNPPSAALDDVAALSYEEARDELVVVVARLEAGGETLEGSLALWERGEALARRCQEWLDGARHRLDAARAAGRTDEAPQASSAAASEDER